MEEVEGETAEGEPAPGVALAVAEDDVVEAMTKANEELVVLAAPLPPRPIPLPKPPSTLFSPLTTPPPTTPLAPAVNPAPTPSVAERPRLRPEESRLSPTPKPAFNETDTPTVADGSTLRMVLFEGPASPTPPLTPTPGSTVAVARTHPFSMFPPLAHVTVIGMLGGDVMLGMSFDERLPPPPAPPRLVGMLKDSCGVVLRSELIAGREMELSRLTLLPPSPRSVGMLVGGPRDSDAEIEAGKFTSGDVVELPSSVVTAGTTFVRVDNRDETPFSTAAGM